MKNLSMATIIGYSVLSMVSSAFSAETRKEETTVSMAKVVSSHSSSREAPDALLVPVSAGQLAYMTAVHASLEPQRDTDYDKAVRYSLVEQLLVKNPESDFARGSRNSLWDENRELHARWKDLISRSDIAVSDKTAAIAKIQERLKEISLEEERLSAIEDASFQQGREIREKLSKLPTPHSNTAEPVMAFAVAMSPSRRALLTAVHQSFENQNAGLAESKIQSLLDQRIKLAQELEVLRSQAGVEEVIQAGILAIKDELRAIDEQINGLTSPSTASKLSPLPSSALRQPPPGEKKE